MADVAENLNNLAKEVFGESGVPDLVPNNCKLQKLIKFKESEAMVLKFVQAVRLAYPQGFTYAKGDGTAGVFAYKDVVGGSQGRAEVNGAQIHLRDQMSYEDALKLTGSAKSFEKGSLYFFEGMQKAMRKRLEIALWYGQQGIAQTSSSTNASATSTVITLAAAYWASGIWSGQEGAALQFYTAVPALVSSGADSVFTVTAVDPILRKITVTGTATGITALDTAIAAGTCKAWFNGAFGNEMTGLHGIIANTGSLFGISAATYSLWGSTTFAPTTAGPLSYDKVKKAVARAVGKGLDEEIDLFISPGAWEDMSNSLASLVRYNGKDKARYEIGAEELSIYGQNGKIVVHPSIHVWEGFAYGVNKDSVKRIGASDVTFSLPGFDKSALFLPIPGYAGVEARALTHQAIFSDHPGKQFYVSNIVNSA